MRTLPNRQQIPHETIHQLLSCQTEKKVITKSITPPRSTIRAEHYCAAPPLGSPQRSDDWPARIADLLGQPASAGTSPPEANWCAPLRNTLRLRAYLLIEFQHLREADIEAVAIANQACSCVAEVLEIGGRVEDAAGDVGHAFEVEEIDSESVFAIFNHLAHGSGVGR